MDNKTDHELIAEFMGWGIDNSFPDKNHVYRLHGRIETKNTFKFHESWDWLMPVVEKIAKIVTPENEIIHNGDESRFDSFYPRTFGMLNAETKQFMVRINRFPLYQADTLIDAAYQSVVDFIKWHNEQSNQWITRE
jgi:hypothetical protein